MKHVARGLAAMVAVVAFSTCPLAAEITANCPGGGNVNLRARFWADELDGDWQGVVIERSLVGECGSGVVLTTEPLQLLPGLEIGDHELSFPVPETTATYRYALKGLESGGGLVDLTGYDFYPTWFAAEACIDEALMMRGTLQDIGDPGRVGIELCPGACWEICPGASTVGVLDLDPTDYEDYLDTATVVNVYGVWDASPPPSSRGCMNAVRIEVIGDCAAPVSTKDVNWGTLKAGYR